MRLLQMDAHYCRPLEGMVAVCKKTRSVCVSAINLRPSLASSRLASYPDQSTDIDEQLLGRASATREEVSRPNAELMYIPARISLGRSIPVSYPRP